MNPRQSNKILIRVMRNIRNAELDYYLPIELATQYVNEGKLFREVNNNLLMHNDGINARLPGSLEARSK